MQTTSNRLPFLVLLVACIYGLGFGSGCSGDEGGDTNTDVGLADSGSNDDLDVGMSDASSILDGGIEDGGMDVGESDAGGSDGGTDPTDVGPDLPDEVDQGPDLCAQPFPAVQTPPADPPFSGTAFITDDLITDSDPTSYVGLTYTGQGQRTMYDRRVARFITVDAHLFDAQFGANTIVEVQVNPEFTRAEAETEAVSYATVIGRLPAFLFRDVETVWIHKGNEPFGGGNNNLLIHTGQGESYRSGGELEEIFIHEAAHTSMDAYHASNPRWLEAATADGVALSTYARDNPNREDVAETLGPYLAATFRPERVDPATVQTIEATIPNRMTYLDCLDLSMDVLP